VRGHRKIVDLDLKTYFDTIPHDKLLALVKQRVRDPSILWLIRRWLKAGIMEQGTFYSSETGSPQGGVISPLLANIYLNAFDQIWHKSGLADGEHQAKLVRFADDSVICCRRNPEKYADAMRQIMQRLGLTVNEEKTKIVDAADGFDFLGMHFRWKKAKNRKMWCFIWPSQKSMKRIRQRIRDKLNIDDRIPVSEIAMHINPVLRGWCNYFRYSNAAEHFVKVDRFVQTRVKRLLRRKRQKRGRCNRDYHASFYRRIGLFFLSGNVKRLPL
jgi:group II intron reverse transcriptase/maturase